MTSQNPLKKNAIARIVFALYKDGELFSGDSANLDAEYSLDGGSFINCNDSTPTEIDSSGLYYIDLLAGETDGDVVALQVKSSTADVVTTPMVFYTSAQTLDEIGTILDTVAVDVAGLNGDAMRGTDSANTVVPDASGVLPTAVEIRQEIDSNSTRLDADMTSRAPASEYDTEMARITADVATEAKQDTAQTDITLIKQLQNNRCVVDVDNSQMILYADDNVTPLLTWPLLDKDGNAISVDTGVPTDRGIVT